MKINRDATTGHRKPRTVAEEATEEVYAGETFQFEEFPGDGHVSMDAEIRADTRGTQFAMHPVLVNRLKKANRNSNWTTSLIALADRGMALLTGKLVTFTANDVYKSNGNLVTYTVEPANSTRIVMEGKLQVCGNPGRKRIAVPLDVRRPIENAIDAGIPFTHAIMALAWLALDDLQTRKKNLMIPKRETAAD